MSAAAVEAERIMRLPAGERRGELQRALNESVGGESGAALARALDFNARLVTACRQISETRNIKPPWWNPASV